ncbi:MAG: DUF4147 domain-containing protein [Patescibacteria group bacterium]
MKSTNQKLAELVRAAIKELDPARLIEKRHIGNIGKFKRVYIVAIGKAAGPMTKRVQKLAGKKVVKVLKADSGHPLPTNVSVRNGKRIAGLAGSLTTRDLVIVLISGGGSAMFEVPAEGVDLKDVIKTTRLLLKSGANINEINVVRKHISQVKGGNLARLLYPAHVTGLIISDVVGNDVSTIASGPLTPDPSTFRDAMEILKKYKLTTRISGAVLSHLRSSRYETPKANEKWFKNVSVKIIADHSLVLKKAMEHGKKLGFNVIGLTDKLKGEARDIGAYLVKNAGNWPQKNDKKKTLYIASGETTVTVRGSGKGGRNQEFVLGGLEHLTPGMTILSVGTDGVDGMCPKKVAGAIGSSGNKSGEIRKFLKNNDSYGYFKKHGGHIVTGPTGTNLGDLAIIVA